MDKTVTLETKMLEIAARIRELREIEGLTVERMARETGVTAEEYASCESGQSDLNFAFLYRCALALNVDITDIIEGASPTLTSYTITRNGAGQRIEQAHGMVYYNLAHAFKHRTTEPLRVTAIYDPETERREIEVTTHVGQECDIVLKGTLKIRIGDHTEILHEGDTAYYDSATPHGMIAVGGQDCVFYAIVINPPEGFVSNTTVPAPPKPELIAAPVQTGSDASRVWESFINPVEDENGQLLSISFKNQERFNFAFDVVDVIAAKNPDKLAMLHIDREKRERRFTFGEMSRLSSRAANYYRSLGIKRGDRVLLVLKRNWQFWISMIALNKLGAIAVMATDQLLQKDFEYRFDAAGITAIVCTANSQAPQEAERAMASCPSVTVRVITCSPREGWHFFDDEYEMFRGTFARTNETPCGGDKMLAFFTSGTTGYPKLAMHNHKYPLGHFVTAHYWQCVDPDGLHLTISDTGWAKAMWGKLYGQWLCEAAVFVYDFDRFDPADILPMFKKYNITTFCAPATMYRFLIREDLSKYDMSSIKHASMAGEALNPEVFNLFKKSTGLSIMEGFGQSEGTVLIGNFRGMASKIGSLGKPTPLYPIDLIDADGNFRRRRRNGRDRRAHRARQDLRPGHRVL